MKFGLFGIGSGKCSDPEVAVRVARAAEAAGFDSVWSGEHVVLPDPQRPPSPVPPHFAMLDPLVALTYIAAHTTTLRLGTGIIILPQRNPLVLAKELASLDVVSRGRLIFGVGVGYLRAEFDALGIPFERRGERTTDYIRAIRAIWTQAEPAYDGPFARFSGIQAKPSPLQRAGPPVVIGGHSTAAFRRAVEHGSGWFGFALDADKTRECLAGIQQASSEYQRPPELGELEISVAPLVAPTADEVHRFEDLGVDRMVLLIPGGRKPDEIVDFIEKVGALVGPS
ncbi:MAG: LLM class F420-dependent oxidoreductase [Myxococcota bacterium]